MHHTPLYLSCPSLSFSPSVQPIATYYSLQMFYLSFTFLPLCIYASLLFSSSLAPPLFMVSGDSTRALQLDITLSTFCLFFHPFILLSLSMILLCKEFPGVPLMSIDSCSLALHFISPPPLSFLQSYHLYSLWVQRLYEDSSASGHTLHQLIECRTFDLLPLQVSHAVQEIKQHAALLQLLTEQIM